MINCWYDQKTDQQTGSCILREKGHRHPELFNKMADLIVSYVSTDLRYRFFVFRIRFLPYKAGIRSGI